MRSEKIKVALVDDHVLMRRSLAGFVNSCDPYQVVMEADNGLDLLRKIEGGFAPDIVLLDINMPVMDGFETSLRLKESYPATRVLALSMHDSEQSIIRMLRNGACGYILKDIEPNEFRKALDAVAQKGVYHSELLTGRMLHEAIHPDGKYHPGTHYIPNEKEGEFLHLICSELTYKEIARKMCLSPRTIDGYRDTLFEKLGIRSRVGLVLFAIRSGMVKI